MTEVTVTDASGESLTMLDIDGFKVSFFGQTAEYIKNVFEHLPNFQFRDDDIFIGSYPKAGCTWTYEILKMLLTGHSMKSWLDKGSSMIEAVDAATIDRLPSPRILNSHLSLDKLPKALLKKGIKIVYVIRNYKDITVSLYNFIRGMEHYHYNGKWEDWLQLHLDGKITYANYFSYAKQWENAIQNSAAPIHVIYYEDLKSETFSELKRLAKFLGVDVEDSTLKEIAENCQFDVMKKKYPVEEKGGIHFKEGTGFFRKGVSGDWKNWYTVAQNDMLTELISSRMENYKTSIHFGAKYEL